MERAGSMACYRGSYAMARAAGASPLGPDQAFQITRSENEATGRLRNINTEVANKAREYIDTQIAKNKPVIVGVSHKGGTTYNADKTTDHFVLITGKGKDEQGRTFYTFHDPGAKDIKLGSGKFNSNNRFYVDSKTGMLYRPGNGKSGLTNRHYEVAQVRRNA
ncbi:MAG: hypothetical protein BWY64_00386 [bacterium ADurb.Bin363]|nr:MAG: hypothetical protein BWY64_00386 [bacterium ADurb.Bin363]